jgi:anti-anti-sigma regulatory factor
MSVEVVDSSPVVIGLGGSLRVGELGSPRALLVDALRAGRAVCLDVGSVEELDSAGLQLLFAFKGEAGRAGQEVSWRGVRHAHRVFARTLGLDAALFGTDAATEPR